MGAGQSPYSCVLQVNGDTNFGAYIRRRKGYFNRWRKLIKAEGVLARVEQSRRLEETKQEDV